MEPTSPQSQLPNPPPAWHQLNYDPPPQARSRTPRQEPQWHTAPPTTADIGYEFRRMGRGLRGMGRDIWMLGILGIGQDIQRFRLFLQHPPRWFWVLLIASGIFADLFFMCSLSGIVKEQATYLRSLMP